LTSKPFASRSAMSFFRNFSVAFLFRLITSIRFFVNLIKDLLYQTNKTTHNKTRISQTHSQTESVNNYQQIIKARKSQRWTISARILDRADRPTCLKIGLGDWTRRTIQLRNSECEIRHWRNRVHVFAAESNSTELQWKEVEELRRKKKKCKRRWTKRRILRLVKYDNDLLFCYYFLTNIKTSPLLLMTFAFFPNIFFTNYENSGDWIFLVRDF